MAVPYIFANATTSIPLSQLDSNFATGITLGSTAAYLGNTVTIISGLTNVSSANVFASNVSANVIGTTANVALSIQSNNTTAIYVDTSQNVGIGTSPVSGVKTVINGVTYINQTSGDGSGAELQITGGVSGDFISVKNTGNPTNGMNLPTTNTVAFYTNSTERARINSGGDFLVGTTAIPSASTGNSAALAPTSYQIPLLTSRSVTTAAEQARFYNPNGLVGNIQTNGSITTFNSLSDYRLKTNVQTMTGALSKVQSLNPCTFTWKVDGSAGQGFIAHELQAVVPDCVSGEKDAVNEDGTPHYQSVDTSFLIATLTAAIQEQQTLITTLQSQVAALQAKVGT